MTLELDPENEQSDPNEITLENEEMSEETWANSYIDNTAYLAMLSEIQSWALWSLGLGAAHLIASGLLSPSWGITLLLVALGSLIYKEAAMFMVYAVTMVWVGLSNLIYSGNIFWLGFGLLQLYLSYRLYRKYKYYTAVEQDYRLSSTPHTTVEELKPTRGARSFPWISLATGIFAVVIFALGFFLTIAQMVISGPESLNNTLGVFAIAGEAAIVLSVLSLATGVAAIFAKFRYKLASWAGTIISAILLIAIILLSL
ncbi:MAG: hypothetical protein JXB38_08650 [Anaerolineales bacterium]|nr:hypothetical protein [Anaerolineales bacterium]